MVYIRPTLKKEYDLIGRKYLLTTAFICYSFLFNLLLSSTTAFYSLSLSLSFHSNHRSRSMHSNAMCACVHVQFSICMRFAIWCICAVNRLVCRWICEKKKQNFVDHCNEFEGCENLNWNVWNRMESYRCRILVVHFDWIMGIDCLPLTLYLSV